MDSVIVLVGMGPGVSAAVAQRFAREGFAVGAVARDAAKLQAALQPLRASGVRVAAAAADAGDAAALQAALASLRSELGDPGVLVYNAAAARPLPLAQLSAEQLMADLHTSVGGALAAAQAVLPAMRARGAGTLLFTGGGFALEPMPLMASLGVGKAGIRNLAYSLFADLKDAGIHAATVTICGVVQPGTAFDPARIADAYWALHCQPAGSFERELLFRGG
jgi:NADP-dependent 3-hydroxy acid dehydrogenase YdfG